jgi:hypothetical protein
MTDESGNFVVEVSADTLRREFGSAPQAIFFKLIGSMGQLLALTTRSHVWHPTRNESGTIEVNTAAPLASSAGPRGRYVVEGVVANADGTFPEEITVEVRAHSLTPEGVEESGALGSTIATGPFRIEIDDLGDPSAYRDLRIVALDGGSVEIASRKLRAISPRTYVDLVVGTPLSRNPGPTQFAATSAKLAPHLMVGGGEVPVPIPIEDLEEDAQIEHVSVRAGVRKTVVQRLWRASKLAVAHPSVSAEAFYGLLDEGVMPTSRGVFRHRIPTLLANLQRAVAKRSISPAVTANLATLKANLETAALEALRTPASNTYPVGLAVDDCPGLSTSPSDADIFLKLLINHTGRTEAFWEAVDASTLTSTAKTRLRFTMEAYRLSGSFHPVVEQLHARVEATTLAADPKALAAYEPSHWRTLIDAIPSGPRYPADTAGADDTERRDNYAKKLAESVERRFRSAVIRSRVATGEASSTLNTFFTNNADFEFETKRVGSYLKTATDPFDGVSDPEDQKDLRERLHGIERVYRLTDRWEDTKRAMDAGYTSASAIDEAGREKFVEDMKEGAATPAESAAREARANKTYDDACWQAGAATAVVGIYGADANKVLTQATPDTATPQADEELNDAIADWTSLFGSPDACECKHCRSVLGPASYLADVLQLLKKVPRETVGTARDIIFERRPDLPLLALSCANTDTALPYVDLVNEILEVKTAGGPWPVSPAHVDTSLTSAELLAQPEIIYPAEHIMAYTKLEAEVYPFNLPFNVWQEEARIYLEHLGVRRAELLEVLAPSTGLNSRHLTLERLGITGRQLDIITGPPAEPTDPPPHAYWDIAEAHWPNDPDFGLQRARVFLDKAKISFDELRELLATQYCIGNDIELEDDAPCNIDEIDIEGLDGVPETHRQFLHRFLRLRKVLGWSISDVGRAHTAFTAFDAAALEALAGIRELQRYYDKLKPTELLAWYKNVDRQSSWDPSPSLFERVFLNKRIIAPSAQAFEAVFSNGSPTDDLDAVRSGLLAALRVSEADLSLLIDSDSADQQLALEPIVDSGETVAIENLSRLYRVTSFAKANKLKLRDFLLLRELSGLNVLQGDAVTDASPDGTLAFRKLAERAAGVELTLEEMHYLIRHVAPEGSKLLLDPEKDIDAWREEIEALVAAAMALPVVEVTDDDVGTTALALAADLDAFATVTDIKDLVEDPVGMSGPSATELITTLTPVLGGVQAAEDAVEVLLKGITAPVPLERRGARYAYLASRFQRYFDVRPTVLNWFAEKLGVELDVAERLVGGRILTRNGKPAVLAFLAGASDESVREGLLVRAQKAFLFAKKLELSAAELDALYPVSWAEPASLAVATKLPAINWMSVPVARPAAAAATATEQLRFELLLRAGELAKLRDRWPAGSPSLFDVFALAATPPGTGVYDRMAAGTGWDRVELEKVAHDALDLEPTDFTHTVPLLRLEKALATIKRLGVPASTAIGWQAVEADLPPDFSDPGPNALTIAREIREAAGAKHEDEAWAEVARPLRNALREKQRDALVGHLLKKLDLPGPNQLYEQLLIDVEMDPCMLTSRMVLAHGSVQHFIQRIQLNLEEAAQLKPNDELAAQWRWMKNYRVWEANRKVFLWPENWIEPELRDDKTPLFEDLEKNLLSGPIDHAAAEEAYRTYLDGLADLSNLRIVAVHVHKDENANVENSSPHTVVHVFGRTRKPHKYYYRRREMGRWFPWEKLDVDVQGDHLMPFTFGGRLYLSWAIIEDVERPSTTGATDPNPDAPDLDTQIEAKNQEIQAHLAAEPAHDEDHAAELAQWYYDLLILWEELNALNAQKAQQPTEPELSTAQPPAVQAAVRLAVSERRSSGWTPPLESEALKLGASPIREWLTFTTEVLATAVTATLLWGFRPIAAFTYHPGTNTHTTQQYFVLTVANDWYGPSVQADDPGIEPYTISRPNPSYLLNQGFTIPTPNPLVLYMVENGSPGGVTVLGGLQSLTHVRADRAQENVLERGFLVVQDDKRAFTLDLRNIGAQTNEAWLPPMLDSASSEPPMESGDRVYRFDLFYHPFVNDFRHAIAAGGLDALLRPVQQTAPGLQKLTESLADYQPTSDAEFVRPVFETFVDFRHSSAYGVYNWELFFHIPFHVGVSLTRDGRYEDAQRWFHYIFDPTDGSSGEAPARYWKLKPFAENADLDDIQEELNNLTVTEYAKTILQLTTGDFDGAAAEELESQIAWWRENPFEPHVIARMRAVTYQKAVVMRYLDNLIQWADSLFSQDTIESINEATQLYVFALNILGPKPTIIPDPSPVEVQSYGELDATSAFDAFSNALVGTEVIAPPPPKDLEFRCGARQPPPMIRWGSPYFCVPANEKLLGYWDTIADRLFKIRNCQNIEGVVRILPLYQPPIDPALLVRAAALGIPFSDVVSELNVAAPHYRYGLLFGKAVELASAVASLGNTYLSVLEKGDAEELANLRQQHEVATQDAILETRLAQAREARESLRATERSLAAAQERFEYYSTREFVNAGEGSALALRSAGQIASFVGNTLHASAGAAAAIPDFHIGVSGVASPVSITVTGGSQVNKALSASARAVEATGVALNVAGDIVGTMAGYGRRKDDWDHQAKLAAREIAQIERQIEAARIRVEIADQETRVVRQQIAQSKEVQRFLTRRFTNAQLYGWMKGEVAAVYYQAYKLAYEAAKRAQKAYEYERGDAPGTAAFIQPGGWNNLRKGLLAGEKLLQDLRRLDAAYTSQNKRELELVKSVSLAEHDPDQLVRLRETGIAGFSLSEDDYDRDFDSHYLRRIKAASITVPCTTGPYQGVLGTLTLNHGATRRTAGAAESEVHFGAIQSIATSQGQSDAGLFELNFRDERLLPFEGAGAQAVPESLGKQWTFELSGGNRFSYDSIDDLVLELRYTARGGRTKEALTAPRTRKRLVRVKREFADAWRAFKQSGGTAPLELSLPLDSWMIARNEDTPTVSAVKVFGWNSGGAFGLELLPPNTTAPAPPPAPPPYDIAVAADAVNYGAALVGDSATSFPLYEVEEGPEVWKVTLADPADAATLDDLWIVFEYEVTVA